MIRKYVLADVHDIMTLIQVFSVTQINWAYMGDAIPAFLTLIMVPFTRKSVLNINNLKLSQSFS
jgi:xanthine/uracil/vitamin C permease (AzgA family)